MTSDKNTSERFEFVGELLNGEELLERLAAAQDVVQSLNTKIRLGERLMQTYKATVDERDGYINRLVRLHIDLAAELARVGSYDHRAKNEAILAVIARLLAYGNNPGFVRAIDRESDVDELPF